MASSASNLNSTYHARSISLPSRPNPLILNIDEQARRLASSSSATTPSSSSSLSGRLGELRDLYDSLNALLELPHTRQLLSHESHKYQVDGLLSSSLYFLDLGSIAKDVLLQRKEQAQDLQSVLRRKRCDESELIKESAAKYLASGKMSKKAISKSLRNLKTKCSNLSLSESEPKDATFGMLTKVEMVSATVFGSLLSFLLGQKAQSKMSSWSLISKLTVSMRVTSEESTESSEFENVDTMLQALIHRKRGKSFGTEKEDLQDELRKVEPCIQDLEEELESVLRCIIRNRAFLLNILTN